MPKYNGYEIHRDDGGGYYWDHGGDWDTIEEVKEDIDRHCKEEWDWHVGRHMEDTPSIENPMDWEK